MIIYIFMVLVSIFFCYCSLKTGKKINKIVFCFLSFFPFFLVSAIRYDVGTDYLFRYVPDYLIIYEGADVPNLEFITKVIIKLCTIITRDYSIFFVISSLIINLLVFLGIYKYSKKPILSILIYFISSTFFLSLNLVRQYIASSILFFTFLQYVNNKKSIKLMSKSTFLILIASLFHTSALLFVPLLILDRKKLNIWLLIVLAIITLFFGGDLIAFGLKLFEIFNIDNLSKYSAYVGYGGNLAYSSLIVELIVYIYFYHIYKNTEFSNDDELKKANFFINIQWLIIIFVIACSINELFIRISSALSIFQIISIPYFYNLDKNNRTAKQMILLVMIIMISRLIYSVPIKGSMDVLPYKTVFNRPENIYLEFNELEYQNNRR